ncbi:alpha/beta hydrolase [Mycobacterium sp. SM3041]|uniref:alpha/beta fold hydrolase n=1 Tax=Mycobacterium sp. SM3041 TaxID=3114291 RepID=UPI003204F15C
MATETGRALDRRRLVSVPAGTLGYRESGAGEPVLCLHGLVANGLEWRYIAGRLAREIRCIAPDLPLGSHFPALPEADLSLPGQAGLVVDLLDALELEQVVLIGNGYGGDIAQTVAADHPERVKALVLIATNAFDSDPWPTKALRVFTSLPGSRFVQPLLTRSRTMQRLPITYGWATKRPIPQHIMDAYLAPLRDRAVADDFARFLRGLSPAHLADRAPKLAEYRGPTLIVWPTEDRVFPASGARRLAEMIPDARLVNVDDSYSWIPEDQPEVLATLLSEFLRTRVLR